MMKLEELLEIIKQKKEDTKKSIANNPYWFDEDYMHELIGQRDAYNDIIKLIEKQLEGDEDNLWN